MSRIVYLNGDYLPEDEAKVSVFDRGFLFADAVYEVTSVLDGKLIAFDGHVQRLQRSCDELGIKYTVDADALLEIHRELVARNEVTEGMVYLQLTRGNPGDRDFVYPPEDTPVTLVLFTQHANLLNNPKIETGMKVITVEDQRWARRDIKTTQLLFPSMAKMMAKAEGVDDAWMFEESAITEGSSNNAYIVKNGKIITRHLGNEILHGITRAAVLKFAKMAQMEVEERAFTVEEARDADEAFITSASTFVMPVVEVDGKPLGDGKPGSVAARLREIYLDESLKQAV
ncbi:D-alanine transaminase [Litoreibacter ponti]|uniref:Probable branched-chain-amino-acid aminotransferase n=1 Tax=Litoreibacter ponti TaxID=1510457 RepID=A0A2T6BN83_9RHOB|nr:D-amino-acid transaminase [Litoreibacter ponti]PTX57494.1 D-alanine transaminase [Litoreibacter ponti]